MAERTKYILDESEMPSAWYNIIADLPEPPPPPLHPGTHQPLGPDDLAPLFPMALIGQEVSGDRYIDIPGAVLDVYRMWRPTPLYRAHRLEKALDTPARIYYKYEGVSPAGSHKPNTAVPQAYYNAQEGTKRITTETGAGQWGSALALACAPVRAGVRGVAGARLLRPEAIPADHDGDLGGDRASQPVRAHRGRPQDPRRATPTRTGSLGIAISEAVEAAASDPRHPLRAGQRAQPRADAPDSDRRGGAAQLDRSARPPTCWSAAPAAAPTSPACPSPSCARSWPGKMDPAIRCVEPAACPSLTKGVYALRLRRHHRDDAAGQDAHPRARLHPRADPRRRAALPRHVAAGLPPLRAGADRGRGDRAGGVLRARPCSSPAAEGIIPAPEPTPRHRRGGPGGAALQGEPARRR